MTLGEVLIHRTPVHELQEMRVTQTRKRPEGVCRVNGNAEARRGTELGLRAERSAISGAFEVTRGKRSLALLRGRYGSRGRRYRDGLG
jgi:ribosomal protein L15E